MDLRDVELELVDLVYDAAEAGIPREKFKERMRKVDEEVESRE